MEMTANTHAATVTTMHLVTEMINTFHTIRHRIILDKIYLRNIFIDW